jgi:hypothetical protein
MERMARRGSDAARRLGTRVRRSLVGAATTVLVVTACSPTDEAGPPATEGPASVAMTVTTIDKGALDDDTRARVESEVSDVLAAYVVHGFLGDFPRDDFVNSFADFEGGLQREAVGTDIEALTVAGMGDVSAVRATRLSARLSFADDRSGQVIGTSAWVDFAFEVQAGDVTTHTKLAGRFNLGREDGAWSVFGYDLVRSGGGPAVAAEAGS